MKINKKFRRECEKQIENWKSTEGDNYNRLIKENPQYAKQEGWKERYKEGLEHEYDLMFDKNSKEVFKSIQKNNLIEKIGLYFVCANLTLVFSLMGHGIKQNYRFNHRPEVVETKEIYNSQKDSIQNAYQFKLDSLKQDYQNKLNQLEKELN
jgi:hypothetical protein